MRVPERRKAPRLNELNKVHVSIVSEDIRLSDGQVFYNYSENLSTSGTKIRGNTLLPIGTLVRIDFTLKNSETRLSLIGRVKWNRIIIKDLYCEAGVEFVDMPVECVQNLEAYIASRQARKNRDVLKNLFQAPSKKDGSLTNDSDPSEG